MSNIVDEMSDETFCMWLEKHVEELQRERNEMASEAIKAMRADLYGKGRISESTVTKYENVATRYLEAQRILEAFKASRL